MAGTGAKRNPAQARRSGVHGDVVNSGMVTLDGDFTIYRAAELRGMLAAHIAAGTRQFDLSAVTDFDSAGVQLLAATRASASQKGEQVEFLNAPGCVQQVCSTLGLQAWVHCGRGAV